jgi:tetratricopeptide (TPR) repeat protein
VALLPTRAAEAAREFARAQREGAGALASLGLGAAALAQDQWDAAAQAFTEARDTGTARVVAAAEYGLAVVAFHRGARDDFKKSAVALLAAEPSSPLAPGLLYVLTGLAVEETDLPGALALAKRLVDGFSADETADDALERVGRAAVTAPAWPIAHEAYTLLRARFPQSPWVEPSRLALAEAQLQTARASEARQALEQFLAASPQDPRAPQAWIMLARAREAGGDRPGALEAYARAARESRGPEWTKDALMGHARLLAQERRWDQARGVLERLLRSDDRAVAVEAASTIGDVYQGEGDHLAAAEFYLSAAYLLPDSLMGRKALLGAARSLAALKQNAAAAIAYKKLLAQSDLPADLADAARQGLAEVGR